jgi:predicted O-methyltransferase YrrM
MRLSSVQVDDRLEQYMESLLAAREPVLARIEEELEEERVPAIGPMVGQLARLLLRLAGCRDVLELGTAVGYSGIWLARGCSGRLVTLETDRERAERARANFREAGLDGRIDVVEEDALSYLERERGAVACVFNDLLNSFPDVGTVERCFELSLDRLSPGGLLLADNALGRGQVVAPDSRQARNIARYNELVAGNPRLESVIVPLRDGFSVARLST